MYNNSRLISSVLRKYESKFQSKRFIVTDKEIDKLLRSSPLKPTHIDVKDTSGGCGAFFEIFVESSEFNGKTLIQQHQMVNEVLKNELRQIHGVTLKTKAN